MRERKTPTKFRMTIRHGDTVKVVAGKDKGKTGRVLTIDPWKNRVTVEHANMIKRHTRPNPQKNIKGGIIDKEAPLHASNVMLLCPNCEKHTRAGYTTLSDGTKTRICRRCNKTMEFRNE